MSEKTLEELEEESQALKAQVEIEHSKVEIARAKKAYGSDYKRILGGVVGGLKGSIHEPPSMMRDR